MSVLTVETPMGMAREHSQQFLSASLLLDSKLRDSATAGQQVPVTLRSPILNVR